MVVAEPLVAGNVWENVMAYVRIPVTIIVLVAVKSNNLPARVCSPCRRYWQTNLQKLVEMCPYTMNNEENSIVNYQ